MSEEGTSRLKGRGHRHVLVMLLVWIIFLNCICVTAAIIGSIFVVATVFR